MKHLKLYEDFKVKNITINDIINCISSNGHIYAEIIKNLPHHNVDDPIKPLSIDNDGLITVDIDGSNHEVELKNVKKIT